MGGPDDSGFVLTVLLQNPTDESDSQSRTFATEHRPDIEQIKALAERAGWTCEIGFEHVPLLAGDGSAEIAEWLASCDYEQAKGDPRDARMNKLERELTSLSRQTRDGFAELKQIIADAVTAGGSVRRVAEPEIEHAQALATIAAGAEADVPRPTGRRDHTMATPEMAGNADFRSNSMAVVGVGAGSLIFSAAAGVDDEGLPKRAPMSRVGNVLHRGTRINGEE